MTSNIGSQLLVDWACKGEIGFEPGSKRLSKKKIHEKVMTELRAKFKPEFLNRIDEIIIFDSLTRDDLSKIVDLQLEQLQKRLEARKIKLSLTSKVKEHLIRKGYNPTFGARPLKRLIQTDILDQLALALIEKKVQEGVIVKVDVDKGKVSIT